jgi:protocatechuate 3,4-dioxygenase beta subunit
VKHFVITTFWLVATAFAFQSTSQQKTSGIAIRGQVLQKPGGQPIRKANVQFIERDGQSNSQYSDTTDADGRFQVDDVKPGRYLATVEHPGFVQSASGKQWSTVLVQPGQGTTDVVFYMQPAAVITGKILDLDGDPMSNVSISALRVGSTQRGRNSHGSGYAATNDLGEFRISDLRAGRYRLTANPPQGLRALHSETGDKVKENLIYSAPG